MYIYIHVYTSHCTLRPVVSSTDAKFTHRNYKQIYNIVYPCLSTLIHELYINECTNACDWGM